jgi:hypothetical protein
LDLLLEISDLFFESVNLDAQTFEVPKDLECLLNLILTFVSISKGKVSVDILWVFVDTQLKRLYSLLVLGPNIEQNSSVIQNDTVGRVKFDRFLIVIESFIEAALTLHIDTHVLEDT